MQALSHLITRTLTLTALSFIALTGCSVPNFDIPSSVADTTTVNVSVKTGETFTLTTTDAVMPYKRELAEAFDTKVLKFIKSETTPPGGLFPTPGDVGSTRWQFQALSEGVTEVHFKLLASDGTDQKRDNVFRVGVIPRLP